MQHMGFIIQYTGGMSIFQRQFVEPKYDKIPAPIKIFVLIQITQPENTDSLRQEREALAKLVRLFIIANGPLFEGAVTK